MNMPTPLASLAVSREPKTMLTTTKVGDQTVVRINFSSLDAIQTCMRKSQYLLHENLRSNVEGEATLFGSAIHKGLESWYLRPIRERRPVRPTCDAEVGGSCDCARCDAINAFLRKAAPLEVLDFNSKRAPANGIKMLDHYIDKYHADPFEVVSDLNGPMVERTFEFTLHDSPTLRIIYFGTVDVVLRNVDAGVVLVTDHKTTSTLGTEFYKRIKPNHQYTGYLMGAKRAMGLDTNTFLVNGLQVAKTKCDVARQVTVRDENDYAEFTAAVKIAVSNYLAAQSTGVWPQSAPNPCSMYGGCTYHNICEANHTLRPAIIANSYAGAAGPEAKEIL